MIDLRLISQYVMRAPLTFMTCVAGTPACVEVIPGSRFPSLYTNSCRRTSALTGRLDPGKHRPDLRSGRKPKRAATSGESLQEEAAPPTAHHVDCQMHEVWQEMCGDEGYCAMHIQCTTALVYNFRALAII